MRKKSFISLFLGVTFESDSEEVVLKNASEIPQGMIRIERPDSVSMYGKNEGSYRVGMKFLGLIRMKDIQVEVVDGSYAIPCGTPVGSIKIKGRYGDWDGADHK